MLKGFVVAGNFRLADLARNVVCPEVESGRESLSLCFAILDDANLFPLSVAVVVLEELLVVWNAVQAVVPAVVERMC